MAGEVVFGANGGADYRVMPNPFGLIDPNDPALRDEPAVALATLVGATGGGSSKKIGAKMIVGRSGRIIGGVTIGGCVDAQVVEAADALVADGGPGSVSSRSRSMTTKRGRSGSPAAGRSTCC